MKEDLERYGYILARLLTIILSMALIYFAVNYFIPLIFNVSGSLLLGFLPFVIAIIIAILIDPIVDWLVLKKRISRGIASALILTILISVIILLLIFIISRLVIELTDLYAQLPVIAQYLMKHGMDYLEGIRDYFTKNPLPPQGQTALQDNMQIVLNKTAGLISLVTNVLFIMLTGLPALITVIIVAGLATFFVSRDKAVITGFIFSLIPRKYVKPMSQIINEISKALVGFFRAQTMLISITSIQTIIGLYLLGIDYALTIGIIVGILDLLPVLGPGSVFIPWAFVLLIGGNIKLALYLLILYGIIVGIRQLIEPKIIAEQIGLHPLATLMSLYLGLQFIGVWGLIIGPFLVIVAKAVVKSMKPQT